MTPVREPLLAFAALEKRFGALAATAGDDLGVRAEPSTR